MRQAQRGFTLVELLVAVSVLGVLGTLVMPSFARDARKARYDSEVSAMFNELLAREGEHKADFGAYHAAAACPSATNDSGTTTSTCLGSNSDWSILGLQTKLRTLRCTYTVSTGCSGDTAVPPANVKFNQGVESWAFVVAVCGTGTD